MISAQSTVGVELDLPARLQDARLQPQGVWRAARPRRHGLPLHLQPLPQPLQSQVNITYQ